METGTCHACRSDSSTALAILDQNAACVNSTVCYHTFACHAQSQSEQHRHERLLATSTSHPTFFACRLGWQKAFNFQLTRTSRPCRPSRECARGCWGAAQRRWIAEACPPGVGRRASGACLVARQRVIRQIGASRSSYAKHECHESSDRGLHFP